MNVKFTSKKGYIPANSVSQVVVSGNLAFVSGQISYDLETKAYPHDSMAAQTHRILNNIAGILSELGLSLKNIAYCNVTISDMDLFPEMDAAYQEHFGTDCPPARKTVEAKIWDNLGLEISAIVTADHEIQVPEA